MVIVISLSMMRLNFLLPDQLAGCVGDHFFDFILRATNGNCLGGGARWRTGSGGQVLAKRLDVVGCQGFVLCCQDSL